MQGKSWQELTIICVGKFFVISSKIENQIEKIQATPIKHDYKNYLVTEGRSRSLFMCILKSCMSQRHSMPCININFAFLIVNFPIFCPLNIESRHLTAITRIQMWSLND